MENWKPVVGYEGRYEVSDLGRVRSLGRIYANGSYEGYWKERIAIIAPFTTTDGYHRLCLATKGFEKGKKYPVHVLVAKAFVHNPEPTTKIQVNHIDGVKKNNTAGNLEWMTCSENNLHAFRTGLNKARKGVDNTLSKQILQYDLNGLLLREWGSIKQIQTELGYDRKSIGTCCRLHPKLYKQPYGFIWRFKNGAANTSTKSKRSGRVQVDNLNKETS